MNPSPFAPGTVVSTKNIRIALSLNDQSASGMGRNMRKSACNRKPNSAGRGQESFCNELMLVLGYGGVIVHSFTHSSNQQIKFGLSTRPRC